MSRSTECTNFARFGIAGMKCGGCSRHVQDVLEKQPNVKQVSVDLEGKLATVCMLVAKGGRQAAGSKLVKLLEKEGFTASLRA
jgi:copper chaperone CopZ